MYEIGLNDNDQLFAAPDLMNVDHIPALRRASFESSVCKLRQDPGQSFIFIQRRAAQSSTQGLLEGLLVCWHSGCRLRREWSHAPAVQSYWRRICGEMHESRGVVVPNCSSRSSLPSVEGLDCLWRNELSDMKADSQ